MDTIADVGSSGESGVRAGPGCPASSLERCREAPVIVAESYQPGVSVSVVARRNDVNANLVSTGGAGFASRLAGLAAWCRWLWSRRRWMLPRGMRRRRDGWRSRWPMAQAAASRPAGAQLDELEASATEDELAAEQAAAGTTQVKEVCAPQAVPGAPAARARGGAGADRLRVLRIGEAVEDRRGRDRDAGGDPAPLEGDPDGAREVHLPPFARRSPSRRRRSTRHPGAGRVPTCWR